MRDVRCAYLAEFPRAEGLHCSSTSVRKVLEFDGMQISEALAFGLGSGLGFFYVENNGGSPSRVINGRAPDLEGAFFRQVKSPLNWAGHWDPQAMVRTLEAGRPLLAQTDLYYLPYYQPPVHFPGHGLVIVGVDLHEATVRVADQGFPDIQTTSLENLKQAMASVAPPLLEDPYRWAPVPELDPHVMERPEAFRAALQRTVTLMEGPGTLPGLPAMERFARSLPHWAALKDALWCARFAYQAIRKRGTDGASFRRLYAGFLREAETFIPELGETGSAALYDEAAGRWENLAALFKEVFASGETARLKACALEAERLAAAEQVALEGLKKALTSHGNARGARSES